jgi:hypothetical protein
MVVVSQAQAAPREDRGKGRATARASSQQAQVDARAASRAIASDSRSSATLSTRSTQTPVVRSDVARSSNVPTSSQMAIRSAPTRSSTYVQRDSDDAQITTQRSRDLTSGTREVYRSDRRDSDRDWSNRRRYHRPPSTVYRSWDRDRIYSWNNNRYRWYGGTWVLYGGPSVVYTESLPAVGGSLVAEVQAELRREGYYRGAVDGVLGPRTRNAIAEFQDDRGLAVNGRITDGLLRELDIR